MRQAMATIGVSMEPTGNYNPAANGGVEYVNGRLKKTMRALLYAGGKPAEWWCFAICHAVYLLMVVGKRLYDYKSSHYMLYGTHPHVDHLRILFSTIYVKHMRRSKRSGTPQQASRYEFVGFHGTGRVKIYVTDNGIVRYAHHATIDEQQLDLSPSARNPAS